MIAQCGAHHACDRKRDHDAARECPLVGVRQAPGGTPRQPEECQQQRTLGLDVREALDSLPSLPLNAGQANIAEAARATRTDDLRRFQFAPQFAPITNKRVQRSSFPVKMAEGTIGP